MEVQPAGSNLHIGELSAEVLCLVWSTAIPENTGHFRSGEEGSKNDQRSGEHAPREKPERFVFPVPKGEQPAGEQVKDRKIFSHR